MKKHSIIALLTVLTTSPLTFAADKPVQLADLPAAVAKAIKAESKDAPLSKITLGEEDGTVAYEAVWEAGGHKHEITVTKTGSVMSLEEAISLAEAPEAVRAAIEKEADGKKVLKVEKVVEKGKTTFEAKLAKGEGKVEVRFDVDGKILERENPGAEKGEKSGGKEKKD